jgi:CDP-diacylglycerol--glycerol-3-phosphate 3-phosphatidyltransferase
VTARRTFWNLPNTLTVGRMVLVPVMVGLLWVEPKPMENVLCCIIFVGAMITDVIDGWLARKWNLTSPVGAYLDPLADKLMVITVLIMLIPLGRVSAWLVALLLCRELAITALRGIASQEGIVMAAETLGKFKTSYQATAIGMLLWHNRTFGIDVHSAGVVTLWIATLFSVVSAVQYFVDFYKKSTVLAS